MLSLIISPIPGDNPMGTNVTYDPDFDRVKQEIGKLGGIDDEVIETASKSILQEKSKDLRVMAFLSFVHLRRDDWEPFADIFAGLTQLVEESFDELFPQRPRAKEMALKWLSEDRFNDQLENRTVSEEDHEHLARLTEALGKLKPILEAKSENSLFPTRLYAAAQKWEKSTRPKPKEEPKPQPATAAPAPGGAAPAAPSTASSAPSQSADPMNTPKEAQTVARKAALFLIEQQPTSAMGYRLLRLVRWDLLQKAPPSDGGQTQLPGPTPEQRTFFQGLLAAGDWKKALPAVEKAFTGAGNHCWLDLQRIAVTAAKALGAEYSPVADAILLETAMLIKRIPEMETLSFADGTPFCDEATKDWLSSEVASALGGDGESSGQAAESDDTIAEERREMNALSSAGKTGEALAYIRDRIRKGGSERDTFRRQLLLGNTLLAAKHPDLAIGVAEGLEEQISRFRLDRWDPKLAVEAWSLLVRSSKGALQHASEAEKTALNEQIRATLKKIGIIDPEIAYKIAS
jgi:type VI secretion system protein VasJ